MIKHWLLSDMLNMECPKKQELLTSRLDLWISPACVDRYHMRTQAYLLLPGSRQSFGTRCVCLPMEFPASTELCVSGHQLNLHWYFAACESHARLHEWSPKWGEPWRLRAIGVRQPQKRLRAGIQLLDFFYFGSVLRSTDLCSTKQGRPENFCTSAWYIPALCKSINPNGEQCDTSRRPHYVLSVYICTKEFF